MDKDSQDLRAQREDEPPRSPVVSLGKALPNLITICAMCCGLTSIRLALIGDWKKSLWCVVIASLLDGVDGKVARYLKADSPLGVELDSLADFLDFGVAPALITYLYALHSLEFWGWILCLFFTICGAMRLARFNAWEFLKQKQVTLDKKIGVQPFSIGVPAPSGAFITLAPFAISLYLKKQGLGALHPVMFGIFIFLSSVLMISKFPCFTLKSVRIPERFFRLILLLFCFVITGLIHSPYLVIGLMGVGYMASIPWSYRLYKGRVLDSLKR